MWTYFWEGFTDLDPGNQLHRGRMPFHAVPCPFDFDRRLDSPRASTEKSQPLSIYKQFVGTNVLSIQPSFDISHSNHYAAVSQKESRSGRHLAWGTLILEARPSHRGNTVLYYSSARETSHAFLLQLHGCNMVVSPQAPGQQSFPDRFRVFCCSPVQRIRNSA